MTPQRLTAYMVDDCLHDPVLGARLLLGFEVPPHMEMRLWGMWLFPFMVDSSGYGTAKSLSIAIVAALRAMLMPGRVGGIVSKTFEQGQLVHQYLDDWVPRFAAYRAQVKTYKDGERAMSLHGQSAWEIEFRNGSVIRTIAPDFKGNAERARSEDWHDGYYDEWTAYPSILAFERYLMTRARKPVLPGMGCPKGFDPSDRVFFNHSFMCGTAKYQWHPCYARITRFLQKMNAGSTEHEVQSWNYRQIPERYHKYVRIDLIEELEESLPKDLAEQEIMGRWVKDSLGFYSSADIRAARRGNAPVLLERSEV